jgi:hypothetical protein
VCRPGTISCCGASAGADLHPVFRGVGERTRPLSGAARRPPALWHHGNERLEELGVGRLRAHPSRHRPYWEALARNVSRAAQTGDDPFQRLLDIMVYFRVRASYLRKYMRPSVGRKSGVHRWSAAKIASRFLPASSSSPNAYCRSSVENRRAACARGIHPRSPSASFSNDDASAFSLVPKSARSL